MERVYLVSTVGVVAVLEIGIVAFCLRCADVLQLPFGKFVYGDLSPISGGTRFGKAFVAMTLGFALVAALVYLAWLLERTVLLVPALVLALGFVAGLSVSGHDGRRSRLVLEERGRRLGAPLGGDSVDRWLVDARRHLARRGRAAAASCSSASRRLAVVLVALVLAAGVYLAIVRLPRLHDLWTQSYGQVLRVKIALVAVVLAWGAAHHFLVRPALERAGDGFMVRVGPQYRRREPRRDRSPARRRDPRRLEAAAQPAAPPVTQAARR